MKQRIAIIAGARTPMGKAGSTLKNLSAADLGSLAVREAIERSGLKDDEIDEVIMGNVSQPYDCANIARVIALNAGLPINIPAYTVHRNCASGMESITSGAEKILQGVTNIVVAGGAESMSNTPLVYSQDMVNFFLRISDRRASLFGKIKSFLSFRLHFLKPVIAVQKALTDPVCGLNMGQTAEVLAREFKISRKRQDQYAVDSHKKAVEAIKNDIFKEEIFPITTDKKRGIWFDKDEGPRPDQSLEKLGKLKPFFDKKNGTVTVGNACPINDGGAALILMSEKEAKKRKLKPLGYLKDYAYASLEPQRMGLGPIYATAKLFKQNPSLKMTTFDLIELNEAFAAQVVANIEAFSSDQFAKEFLNRQKALGKLDEKILNVNGGAVALGHPVGMTGTRIVLHLLYEMKRRNKKNGLATLCIGGGQGAALHLQSQ